MKWFLHVLPQMREISIQKQVWIHFNMYWKYFLLSNCLVTIIIYQPRTSFASQALLVSLCPVMFWRPVHILKGVILKPGSSVHSMLLSHFIWKPVKKKRSLRHWGQIKLVFKSSRRVIASIWKKMVRARTHKYRLKELSVFSIKKPQWSDGMAPWAILFLLRWKNPN